MKNTPRSNRLLKLPSVLERYPVSKTKLYQMVKENRFPAPKKIGVASFWVASEVDAFVDSVISG